MPIKDGVYYPYFKDQYSGTIAKPQDDFDHGFSVGYQNGYEAALQDFIKKLKPKKTIQFSKTRSFEEEQERMLEEYGD